MKHLKLVLVLIGASTVHAAAVDCDRDCLRGFITQYLRCPGRRTIPACCRSDKKVRFTEDSVEMHLGDGCGKTLRGIRAYRQDVLDVAKASAASQVIDGGDRLARPVDAALESRR